MNPKHRLSVKSLVSIGAVDDGDNPDARIMFWKRKPEEPLEGHDQAGGSVDIDLTALDETIAKAIEEHVAALEAEIAALKGEPEPLPDVPDVVAKRLDTLEKRAEDAEARLAAMVDEQAEARYAADADRYAVVLGEDSAGMLKAFGQADPGMYAEFQKRLDTLTSMERFDTLLKEHGDSAAEGAAIDVANARAEEIRKNQPELSLAAARAQVWREDPALLKRHREEG